MKEKGLSPIISVILLIVITVILAIIILSFGKEMSSSTLSKTDIILKEDKDIAPFIFITSAKAEENLNYITISNTNPIENITLSGYKLIFSDNNTYLLNSNEYIVLDSTVTIPAGGKFNFTITCFPEDKFIIELILDGNKFISKEIKSPYNQIENNCIKSSDFLLFQDYSLGNSTDLSSNNNSGIDTSITYNSFGASFNGSTSKITISNNNTLFLEKDNFAIETVVDENYVGHIVAKNANHATTGGLDLYVSNNYIYFNALPNKINYVYAIGIDNDYIYGVSQINEINQTAKYCLFKKEKESLETIIERCDLNASVTNNIATDENYLYLTLSHKLYKINKTNLVIEQFVGSTAGSGNTQFSSPKGVYIYDGLLYISDSSNNRIKVHSAEDLSFVENILSSSYSADQNFLGPRDTVVDENYIFILSYTSKAIIKLNKSDKSFVTKFYQAANFSDYDYFYDPVGLTGDEINLYGVVLNGGTVFKIDKNFNQSSILRIGNWGYNTANHFYPYAITYSDGKLYIADSRALRIVVRNSSDLSFVKENGVYGNRDYTSMTIKITGDENYIYYTNYSGYKVIKASKDVCDYVNHIGGPGFGNSTNLFNSLGSGITKDNDGYIYVMDTINNRIVKIDSADMSYVDEVGSFGSGIDQFSFYYYNELATDGNYLYVSDYGNHRIVKIRNSDLNYISEIGTYGTGNDNFKNPTIMTVDNNGFLYVGDSGNNRIVKRRTDNLSYVSALTSGSGNDSLSGMNGLTVDDNGNLYILRRATAIVKRRTSDFSLVSINAPAGSTLGLIGAPENLMSDGVGIYYNDGKLYVGEWFYGRLSIWDAETLKKINTIGDVSFASIRSNSQISGKTHLLLTRNNNSFCIYINGQQDNCKEFNDWDLNLTYTNLTIPYLIGSQQNGENITGNGTINYIRLIKDSITPAKALQLYNLEKSRLE